MTNETPASGSSGSEETATDGGPHAIQEGFDPQQVARIVERTVAQVTNDQIGAIVGMAYAHLTDAVFLGLWAGSVYLFTYSLEFANYSRNLALINITIGTFVLMAGANLIEKFDEQALNFRAYIHNSITFIASGIALLLGFISRQIVTNYTFRPPFDLLASAWLLGLNIVASFLFLISVWVLLKLLWRLDRLISRSGEFRKSREVYNEFRESIEGLSAEHEVTTNGDGEERSTAVGLAFSAVGLLVLAGGPYYLTGSWTVTVAVVAAGYLLYAGIRLRQGEIGSAE